jgi:RNA recognition motif-containing protein
MEIYVGKISSDVSEEDVRKAFEVHGSVASVSVKHDPSAGESLGCAFVEMPSDQEALAAISALSESNLKGCTIQVNQARTGPSDRRRPGRGGGRRKDDPKPGVKGK